MDYSVNGLHVYLEQGDAIFVNSRRLHYGYSAVHQERHYNVPFIRQGMKQKTENGTKRVVPLFRLKKDFLFDRMTAEKNRAGA